MRRKVSPKVRENAVKQITAGEATVKDVARRLGVSLHTVYTWRSKARIVNEQISAAKPVWNDTAIHVLRAENARLRRAYGELLVEKELANVAP